MLHGTVLLEIPLFETAGVSLVSSDNLPLSWQYRLSWRHAKGKVLIFKNDDEST